MLLKRHLSVCFATLWWPSRPKYVISLTSNNTICVLTYFIFIFIFVCLNVYVLEVRKEDNYSELCNKKQTQNSSLVPVNGILVRRTQHSFVSRNFGNKNFVVTDRSHSRLEGLISLYFSQKIINKILAKMQNTCFNWSLL